MPTIHDMTDEQKQAQGHPPAWSRVFGSEREGDRILRLGKERREKMKARGQTLTRSADIHEQRALRGRAERKAERQLRVLDADAQERREDDAYERAIELRRRGREPDAQTLALAMASRARRDLGPKVSSAEQHAEDYQSHNQADNSADIEFEV